MLSDDYLLRMIRQATAVIARIIGLKKSGDYQDALQEIDQNLEQLFGLDGKLIRLLDEESLYGNLSTEEPIHTERVDFIAELFKEEGEIFKLQGNLPESENSFGRSLSFYLMMELTNDESHPIALSHKIDAILQNITKEKLQTKTLFDVFCHFENEGDYSKAEEILNILITRPEATADARREMKLFYERLLEKEPIELSAHGMNRKNIQKKIKDL